MALTQVIIVKNLQNVSATYAGQLIDAESEYQIQTETERQRFSLDEMLIHDLYASPANAAIASSVETFTNPVDGQRWLNSDIPKEVVPTTTKNEHNLRPYGLIHKHIDASDYIFDITLSNKDGKDIDYSCTETPVFYDCISQEDTQIKDGVLSRDGSTLTMFFGKLSEGTASLRKPIYIDYTIEITENKTEVYLWGLYCEIQDYGEDDVVRFQIMDITGFGVALGWYTQAEFEAMGSSYIVKEYDECWSRQLDKITNIGTPDGAPGAIPVGATLRISYYPSDATKTDIKIWVDYKITIKDS